MRVCGCIYWSERRHGVDLVGGVIEDALVVFDLNFVGGLFVLVMEGNGVFKLLYKILVDGFSTLKNRPAIFEALNLFKDKA